MSEPSIKKTPKTAKDDTKNNKEARVNKGKE